MRSKVHLVRYLGNPQATTVVFTFILAATILGDTRSARGASITALGDLPGNAFYSIATGVSSNGDVVVGLSASSDGQQAFRWTQAGGMVGLGYLPGAIAKSSVATGVSADGAVTVGYGMSTNFLATAEAFRWTQATGIIGMGFLPGGSAGDSFARGVSADGSVVVGSSSSSNGRRGFRWAQQTGMIGLGTLPSSHATNSEAFGISNDGTIVVGRSTSGTAYEPFRWNQDTGMQGLGYLIGAIQNTAYAVSRDGAVVVGQRAVAGGWEGFKWTPASGMLGIGGTQANGVSADGRVAVGYGPSTNAVGSEAYLWFFPGGAKPLQGVLVAKGVDMSYWRYLTEAKAVSPDGDYVTGYGVNTSGNTEAFLAHVGPTIFVSISRAANQELNLSWSGATSNAWIQFTPCLPAMEWTDVAGPLTGTNYALVAPANQTNGFYRVRAD